jgi:hypothetical protein
MTKKVRIENADTSANRVIVEVWQRATPHDVRIEVHALDHPTDLKELYVHGSQYIVVSEPQP